MGEGQNEGRLAALRRLLHIEKVSIYTSVPDHPGYRPTSPVAHSFEGAFIGTAINPQRVIALMNDPNFMEYALWRNMQQDRLLELVAQEKDDPRSLIPDNWSNASALIQGRLRKAGWTDKEVLAGLMVARGTIKKPEVPQV